MYLIKRRIRSTGAKSMNTRFLVGFYLVLVLFAAGALADEIIDSGWVEIKPSEPVKGVEGPRIIFSDIKVLERSVIRSD